MRLYLRGAGKHFGDARYAWDFATTPQVHSNGISYAWPRGKVLGGSSAINFYVRLIGQGRHDFCLMPSLALSRIGLDEVTNSRH